MILVHLWCIQNKLVLKKDTDIIHVAMGGSKKFSHMLRGFKKFWRLAKGGQKVWRQKFSIAQPPHQSIYEHSLIMRMSVPSEHHFFFFSLKNALISPFEEQFRENIFLSHKHNNNYDIPLTAHNWQKWKRVFLTCPRHEIYRDEAVGLKSRKYTWKIKIYVNMWNLEQFHENLIFVNNCLIQVRI